MGQTMGEYLTVIFIITLCLAELSEAVPSFTEEPRNPSRVDEGDNITLRWTYSIDGTFRDSRFTIGSGQVIALKDGSGVNVVPEFSDRVQVFISDSEASLTLLHVNRSDGREYQYLIQNTAFRSASSVVKVFVQFKPDNVQLLTNFTANKTCPGSFWNFTCLVGPAKPDMLSYQLFANDVVVDTDSSGMWVRLLSSSGVFTYKCLANNSVGTTISENEKNITVAAPASVLSIVNSSYKAIEGDPFVVTCEASGDPKLIIYWIKEDNDQRINGSILNFTSINRNDNGTYRCEVENDCASDSRVEIVNVSYPPNITYISANMTVNQSEPVNLTCRANGNPKPTIIWTKDSNIINSSFTVRGKSDEGLYVCTADNGIGNAPSKSMFMTVDYFGPFNTTLTKRVNIVYLNTAFNLSCSAQASPPASYRFYRGQESLGSISVGNTFTTSVVQRTSQVSYACLPFNYFGDGPTVVIVVEVYYSPQVTERNKTYVVSPGNSATLTCPVDGNPPPSVRWYKGNDNSGQPLHTGKAWELSQATLSDSGLYTCSASNSVGTVRTTVILEVEEATTTVSPSSSTNVNFPLQVTLVDAEYLQDYENLNSQPAQELISKFVTEMDKLYDDDAKYDGTEVTKLSKGSVIVSFEVLFKTPVTANEGLAKLRDAVNNNKRLGNFTVEALKIIQPVNPTTAASTEGSTDIERCQCNEVIWKAVTGVLIFVNILLVVVIVWQQKRGSRGQKRPYALPRDDTEVYDNEIAMDEVQLSHSRQSKTEYMDLEEVTAFESKRKEEVTRGIPQVERSSLGTDYAPLHPSTRSWEIPRNSVTIEKVIGRGAFGQVAKGTAIDVRGRPGNTPVAVKMLKASAPESDRSDLLSELELMKTLKPHPHVIRLLGCVTETEPLLVLIEYVPYGDLLGYLRKSRGLNDTYFKDPDIKPRTNLTSEQLMKFAWQIADGMSYLSSRSIIHRDLAARNVLVGERETCKVTDFGMARNVQQENIYERKTIVSEFRN